ncbi:hypothetical protein Tco_0158851 [Tanacetum coccineum]
MISSLLTAPEVSAPAEVEPENVVPEDTYLDLTGPDEVLSPTDVRRYRKYKRQEVGEQLSDTPSCQAPRERTHPSLASQVLGGQDSLAGLDAIMRQVPCVEAISVQMIIQAACYVAEVLPHLETSEALRMTPFMTFARHEFCLSDITLLKEKSRQVDAYRLVVEEKDLEILRLNLYLAEEAEKAERAETAEVVRLRGQAFWVKLLRPCVDCRMQEGLGRLGLMSMGLPWKTCFPRVEGLITRMVAGAKKPCLQLFQPDADVWIDISGHINPNCLLKHLSVVATQLFSRAPISPSRHFACHGANFRTEALGRQGIDRITKSFHTVFEWVVAELFSYGLLPDGLGFSSIYVKLVNAYNQKNLTLPGALVFQEWCPAMAISPFVNAHARCDSVKFVEGFLGRCRTGMHVARPFIVFYLQEVSLLGDGRHNRAIGLRKNFLYKVPLDLV